MWIKRHYKTQGPQGQCSNRRRVSNKGRHRVSFKRRGFEVRVVMNAGRGVFRSFTLGPMFLPVIFKFNKRQRISLPYC